MFKPVFAHPPTNFMSMLRSIFTQSRSNDIYIRIFTGIFVARKLNATFELLILIAYFYGLLSDCFLDEGFPFVT